MDRNNVRRRRRGLAFRSCFSRAGSRRPWPATRNRQS